MTPENMTALVLAFCSGSAATVALEALDSRDWAVVALASAALLGYGTCAVLMVLAK